MAFILAVNPGSSQSPTLARLARELAGCELIGADTFEIATRSLEQRAPDLVLLPEVSMRGEAEFLSRLGGLPRGVSALRLPQPSAVDFGELTEQIRALLDEHSGAGVRAGASAHLIAAARAAVRWVRAQRGLGPTVEPRREPVSLTPAATYANRPAFEPVVPKLAPPGQWQTPPLQLQPSVQLQLQPPLPQRPAAYHPLSAPPTDMGPTPLADEESRPASHWPKVAAAALIALVAAGAYYWPDGSSGRSSQVRSSTPEAPVATPAAAPSDRASGTPPADRATDKPAPDSKSQVPGWIAVFAPFEISISEGNTTISLDDSGRALLPPGAHKLRFRNQALSYDEVRTVQIAPTETTSLSLTPDTTLAVTSNEPAEVLLDGTSVGQTPLKGLRIPFGTHTVVVRTSGSERALTVEATAKPVQLDLFFSKP